MYLSYFFNRVSSARWNLPMATSSTVGGCPSEAWPPGGNICKGFTADPWSYRTISMPLSFRPWLCHHVITHAIFLQEVTAKPQLHNVLLSHQKRAWTRPPDVWAWPTATSGCLRPKHQEQSLGHSLTLGGLHLHYGLKALLHMHSESKRQKAMCSL